MCRYELHIRDFSAMDLSVPEHLRGKYLAFAQPDSLTSDFTQVIQPSATAGNSGLHKVAPFGYEYDVSDKCTTCTAQTSAPACRAHCQPSRAMQVL